MNRSGAVRGAAELRKNARRACKCGLLGRSQSAADGVKDQRLGMLNDLQWNCRSSNLSTLPAICCTRVAGKSVLAIDHDRALLRVGPSRQHAFSNRPSSIVLCMEQSTETRRKAKPCPSVTAHIFVTPRLIVTPTLGASLKIDLASHGRRTGRVNWRRRRTSMARGTAGNQGHFPVPSSMVRRATR